MSIARRVLRGTPLLVSAAGAIVTIASGGCSKVVHPHPVGNLMPPPTMEVCVQVTPADAAAQVTLDGQAVDERGCAYVDRGMDTVTVDIQAEGYAPVHESAPAEAGQTLQYTLTPAEAPPDDAPADDAP